MRPASILKEFKEGDEY